MSRTLWFMALVLALLALVVAARLRRPVRVDRLPANHAEYRVRINSADVTVLALLPRVGPEMAQRIVQERRAHGPFQNSAALRRVRGLGEVTLARIEPFIGFEGTNGK